MLIKNLLRRVAEKLTGKKCSRCKFNCCGHCTHPDPTMFDRCWNSVTMPGFLGKYESPSLSYAEALAAAGEALQKGITEPLTPEEEYQLGKIKAALEEAGEIARESGLLEG